jgi:hypothetical protein
MKPSTKLQTPLGIGTLQGVMQSGGIKLLIRLPINEKTEPHRKDSNCVTKRATASGLWLFEQAEVKVTV